MSIHTKKKVLTDSIRLLNQEMKRLYLQVLILGLLALRYLLGSDFFRVNISMKKISNK